MFSGMAHTAQHLNVCGVSPQGGCCAMRFNVMPLQVVSGSAFFTVPSFCNNLRNRFSACVSSFTAAIIPFGMIDPAKSPPSRRPRAFCGAVFPGSSASFANLKRVAAFLADTINHGARFVRLEFVRASTRTSIGFPSHMSVWARELFPASGASQRDMPAPFNFSLES